MEFLNKLRAKKQAKATTDFGAYCALISKGAESGELNDKDQAALEKLADVLGRNVEQMEADFAAISEVRRYEAEARGKVAAGQELMQARKALTDYVTETKRLQEEFDQTMRERAEQESRLTNKVNSDNYDHELLIQAENNAKMLRHRHWQLLGLIEQPPLVREEWWNDEYRAVPTTEESERISRLSFDRNPGWQTHYDRTRPTAFAPEELPTEEVSA